MTASAVRFHGVIDEFVALNAISAFLAGAMPGHARRPLDDQHRHVDLGQVGRKSVSHVGMQATAAVAEADAAGSTRWARPAGSVARPLLGDMSSVGRGWTSGAVWHHAEQDGVFARLTVLIVVSGGEGGPRPGAAFREGTSVIVGGQHE